VRTPKRYEAKDGAITWRVRFREGGGRTGRSTSVTFDGPKAEDDALRFCQLLEVLGPEAALKQVFPDDVDRPATTLDEVAAERFKYLTGIETGTRLDYERTWARTWSPLIGFHVVAQYDTLQWRDAISEAINKLGERYAPKSLKNHRGLLSGVFDRAVDLQLVPRNPSKGIRLPDVTVDADEADDEMLLLSMAEFDILCSQFAGVYRTLVRFLVGTGCRWGEAVVLRRRDFDLTAANPVVRIRRALKRRGDGVTEIRGPKTKKSRRTIVLPRELVAELRELMVGGAADDLVFTGPKGGMIAHRNFWYWQWRPAICRAQRCDEHREADCRCGGGRPRTCKIHPGTQLPEPCGCAATLSVTPRIHDLRHTHASWLLASGVPIHIVQARLGHESIQTTVDTYGHLLPDAQIAAAEAASAAFAQLTPAAQEAEIQRELAGLDQLLAFLEGDDELPPAVEAALLARGWVKPPAAIEAPRRPQ
jgi:integrase